MSDIQSRDKGITYILIAVICILIFIVGYQIMSNNINILTIFSKEKKIEAAVENKLDDKKLPSIDVLNKFYLNVIVKYNSCFDYLYKKENQEYNFFKSIFSNFNPVEYIVSQLPVINLLDFKELNKGDKVKVINNIEIVEEVDKTAPVFNEIDDNIEEHRYEEIIFIDPYEGENIELPDTVSDISDEELKFFAKSVKKLNVDDNKPYILIYHTHTSESYLPKSDDNFHVKEKEYNVLSIGEIISNGLREKGHKLVYVDKYHDLKYNESYKKSRDTIKKELDKEKNIKILIDIHRDAGTLEYKKSLEKRGYKQTVNINGEEVATFSLVLGPDNPNISKLEEFAKYIKKVSDQMYPGLCSRIIVKEAGRFNMYYSDYSILLEVGSIFVTNKEAQASAKLIVNVLDKALEGIK